ncbi:MAG: hypothetical protein AB7P03_12455 [Kofleriaceae bacterium]
MLPGPIPPGAIWASAAVAASKMATVIAEPTRRLDPKLKDKRLE